MLDSLCVLSREGRREPQLFESRLKEVFVYGVDPSLPLNLFLPPPQKMSPTGIAQEDKPLE